MNQASSCQETLAKLQALKAAFEKEAYLEKLTLRKVESLMNSASLKIAEAAKLEKSNLARSMNLQFTNSAGVKML